MRKRLGDFLPLILVGIGLCILLYPTVSNFWWSAIQPRHRELRRSGGKPYQEKYAQMLGEARAYNEHLAQMTRGRTPGRNVRFRGPIDAAVPAEGLPALPQSCSTSTATA